MKRVLIVDDETKVAAVIQSGLAERGIGSETCYRGDEVLGRVAQQHFDGVILDIMLPGCDGLSVLRQLRSQGHDTPVLLLTARGDIDERVEGLENGADDYLIKPFAMAELVARLGALGRRRGGPAKNVITHADIVMNLSTRQVSRDKQSLPLSPREFSVLECLMRTPGKVHTRTELLQHVWGYQFDPRTNVVDVAVKRLRRKLDDGFARPLIRSVRGVGYLLEDET